MSAASVEPAYPRVAFQGAPGAYGDAAIALRWRSAAEAVPARTFDDALAMLCAGHSDYAVIPVWNSAIGDLALQRQALARVADRTCVLDEILVPVRHCLLALPGASLERVRVVASHPAALAQCTRFLADRPHLSVVRAFDTAGAARELARVVRPESIGEGDRPHQPWYADVPVDAHALAVIASAAAASRYGLVALAEGIQDDPSNTTRFVVVRVRQFRTPPGDDPR